MKIKYMKLYKDAKEPRLSYERALGIDLPVYSPNKVIVIQTGQTKLVNTGLAFEPIGDYSFIILPRSSYRKQGVLIDGVIDTDYRGEVKLMVTNFTENYLVLSHGDYIAQMIVLPNYIKTLEKNIELSKTKRGDKGFGSSGK